MSSSEDEVEEEVETQEDEEVTEEVEEPEDEVEEVEVEEGTVYMYLIPLETVKGVLTPAYKEQVNGTVYLHHTDGNYRYLITENATPHYHKEDVNIIVRELDKKEVLNSDNRVRDFV